MSAFFGVAGLAALAGAAIVLGVDAARRRPLRLWATLAAAGLLFLLVGLATRQS